MIDDLMKLDGFGMCPKFFLIHFLVKVLSRDILIKVYFENFKRSKWNI